MSTSYLLSTIEPNLIGMSVNTDDDQDHKMKIGTNLTNLGNMNRSPDLERNLSVVLDDRDLWCRFQNLINEMIVTKNGRLVLILKVIAVFIYK